MKFILKKLGTVLSVLILLFVFQNCGSGSSSAGSAPQASEADGLDSNTPNDESAGSNGEATHLKVKITTVYRYFHPAIKDHYYLLHKFESSASPNIGGVANPLKVGYVYEGEAFYVIDRSEFGLINLPEQLRPLYACLSTTHTRHYTSLSVDCESSPTNVADNEGLLGYIFRSVGASLNEQAFQTTALKRCFWNSKGHLTTPAMAECQSTAFPADVIEDLGFMPNKNK